MRSLLPRLLLCGLLFVGASGEAANELANPGFEEHSGETLAAWTPCGRGCTLDRETLHAGRRAICCAAAGADQTYGVRQIIRYERPDRRPIIIGGWSKAEGVGAGGDYNLFLDVIYDDGTPWWGKISPWSRGTHEWEYTARVFWPQQPAPADDQDYMDWYCPLTPNYDRELSARLRAQGKQVWWYVCCGPRHPYANFASIDYPTIEGRLLAWMTYGYQADGLLYWHVNLWHPNKVIAGDDPYLAWRAPEIAGMTGDGCLTYPLPDGPASSIRLEAVRDGLEDYDYLALLADRQGRPAAEASVAGLITSLTEFNRDPAALARVREAIAERLEAAAARP